MGSFVLLVVSPLNSKWPARLLKYSLKMKYRPLGRGEDMMTLDELAIRRRAINKGGRGKKTYKYLTKLVGNCHGLISPM